MAILFVITSSVKIVADTKMGSSWLYSDKISLRRVRELSLSTSDPLKGGSIQEDLTPGKNNNFVSLSLHACVHNVQNTVLLYCMYYTCLSIGVALLF